ncbi:MAG: cupin domain-containing protein [Geminicoccaceae bacterium]|nr:cupin domain-containing protein [Geminicoccaceae bacterium]
MSQSRNPIALDPGELDEDQHSDYPQPHREAVRGRARRVLGDPFGLTQFGVNLTRLPPGAMSAQRHWHSHEDELVYLLDGEVVLVTDAGETPLEAGMCAGFPANSGDGHHLVNRSDRDALYLEIGSRRPDQDVVTYTDIDMVFQAATGAFFRKSGEPY